MTTLRMGAVAAEFGRDLEADFLTIEHLIKDVRDQGVRLLALPEACLGGYLLSLDGDDTGSDPGPPPLALDGPEMRRLITFAGDMTVVAGYCEDGGDERYNSVVCVSGDGVLGNHRKVHQPLGEDASYAAGDRFHAFDTPVGRLGMVICYDKAFPESARALALDGAQIGVCVSAWPGSRTNAAADLAEDRWKRRFDLFDRARALENQMVWLSANQSGTFGHCDLSAAPRSSTRVGRSSPPPASAAERPSPNSTSRVRWKRPVAPWGTCATAGRMSTHTRRKQQERRARERAEHRDRPDRGRGRPLRPRSGVRHGADREADRRRPEGGRRTAGTAGRGARRLPRRPASPRSGGPAAGAQTG